jgi:macrolide transport system ATP-binding/permease protein
MELIRVEAVCKTYHTGVEVPVLRDVSLTLGRGELVALMGASGSGKTTLMNILGCLDRPTAGRYWLDGSEVSALTPDERARLRNEKIGFVFQNFNLLPRTTALENVLLPLECSLARQSDGEMRARARALLERVGLGDRLDHEPSAMSGGQQQRVAIARALVNRPALLLADEPTGNLDSHTSADILRMLQELNAEGLTILLVTHDPAVAAHARRVIDICDGRIEDDRVVPPHPAPVPGLEASPLAPTPAPETSPVLPSSRRRLLPRPLRTALKSLRRNRLRSALTTLGIVMGVAAVIAMMEIGEGSRKAVQQSIASTGANTVLVVAGAASSGGVTFGAGTVQTLTPADAQAVARDCPGVLGVSPIVRARTQVIHGNRNWVPAFIYGTTPAYLQVRDWEQLQEGVPFTDRDVRNGSQVCLVGRTVVREVFRERSPVGKEIRIQNVPFKVIGALGPKGANVMGLDQDDVILAPWTTIKYRVSATTLASVNQSGPAAAGPTTKVNTLSELYPGAVPLYPVPSPTQQINTPQPIRFPTIDRILVKAASPKQVPEVIRRITTLLRERHRLRQGQENDFGIRDMTEMTRALESTSRLIGGLLLCVALISLLVGGVGIMNIMLVSVTERTREVGLRMAVGARPRLILRQFLLEAVVLCLLGGVVGILAGRGASLLVRALLHWPTEASLPAIAVAVGVSVTVGILFGFYPAWKASRLDPIEALRYE